MVEELLRLQNKLGKKQSFEDAVGRISSIVCDHYSLSASQDLRRAVIFILFSSGFDWFFFFLILGVIIWFSGIFYLF